MARKVLIVEDDSNIAELLHLYLEKEGFETAVAGDGGKGVELFRSFHPDLVLLDLMLPGMDGFEVCRPVRESGSSTPIIMLTAREEETDKVLGLELGADDYITKPFSMRELLARVKALLRRSSLEKIESEPEDKITAIKKEQAEGKLVEMAQLLKTGPHMEFEKLKLESDIRPQFPEAEYCKMVEKAKHYIREGDIFQVVLSLSLIHI